MNQLLGLVYNNVLAEGDLFELLGPLLLFGIYAIGTLVKKLASSKESESDEKKSSELQKAVRRRYQAIHDKQTGKAPIMEKVRSPRQSKPYGTELRQQTFEKSMPPPRRSENTVYPAHIQKTLRSVRQKPRTEPYPRSKTETVITRTPKFIHTPESHKKVTSKIVTVKKKDAEHSILQMIRQPQNLRTAIIMKEILDKPVSLRNDY